MQDSSTPERAASLTTFVGRARELAELSAALNDAKKGQGRLLLLSGEPGIGKTRLADELVGSAVGEGVRVVWGRCWEGGGAPAYWPFRQVIRACIEGQDAGRQEVLFGGATREIAQLIPELRSPRPLPEEAKPASDPASARFRLFSSVTAFLRNAARLAPLLIVIDDLHDADQPSLQMLRFVARETKDARIMIVGTYREAEIKQSPELGRLIGDLIREGWPLPLAGLSQAEVEQFVEKRSGRKPEPNLVTDLYRATNGNPLFVDGVVRLLIAETSAGAEANALKLPDGVRESIRRRLAALPVETIAMLTIAAVVGNEFDLQLLEQVSQNNAERIVELLDDTIRFGIVTRAGGPLAHYRFSHALVREALYKDLPARRRIELHRLIGAAIEKIFEHDLKSQQAQLAYHFTAANIAEKAIPYSIGAGEAAAAVFAYHEARSHWETALELMQGQGAGVDRRSRATLSHRLAALCWMVDYAAAIRFEEAALSLYKSLGNEQRAAECHAALGMFYAVYGEPTSNIPRAREHFHSAEAFLSKGPETLALVSLYTGIAQTSHVALRTEEGIAAGKRSMEMARRLDAEGPWAAAAIQYAINLVAAGRLAENRTVLEQGWQISDRLNVATSTFIATWGAGECHLFLLDTPEARRCYERELSKPRSVTYRSMLNALLGETLARAGDLEAARRLSAETAHTQILAGLLFYEGKWSEAEAVLKEQVPNLRRSGDLASLTLCLNIWANICAVCDRPHEALAFFGELLAAGAGELQLGLEILVRPVSATIHAQLGQLDTAERELTRCREVISSGEDWRGLGGTVARAEAVVAAAQGRFEAAEELFEKANEVFQRYQTPFEEAETLYHWAHALKAAGKQTRANEKLDAAITIYRRCGAGELWIQRAEASRAPASASQTSSVEELAKDEAVFRREGDYWTLIYGGKTSRLKDAKGFRYLAHLLAHPGEEIRALDLVALETPGADAIEAAQAADLAGSQSITGDLGDAGEVLDARAKVAYKRRLNELSEELEEARELGDERRIERAEEEIQSLGRELKGAIGLSGRARRAASPRERARIAVTQAIRSALDKIAQNNPNLSVLLTSAIKTGTACSYLPARATSVRWML